MPSLVNNQFSWDFSKSITDMHKKNTSSSSNSVIIYTKTSSKIKNLTF